MAATLLGASAGQAVELLDGRFQLHGFYENQTRVIARNFSGADDWDLTQWYQVLNLEMEFDLAPDGWGPFDIISAYARVEARFDCVYDRACWLFPAANSFGDRTEHLPKRLSDSRRTGYTDNQFTGHVRKRHGIPRDKLTIVYGVPPKGPIIFDDRVPMRIWNVPGIDTLFGGEGANGILGDFDDPAPFILGRFDDFKFASRKVRGTENGVGTQVLGPWLPRNFVDPVGALADRPNPFSPLDFNPVLPQQNAGGALLDVTGTPIPAGSESLVVPCGAPGGFVPGAAPSRCFGSTAQPFRPAPQIPAGTSPADQQFARGIYYPNSGLANIIRDDNLDNPDQNFREAELKWNKGASQQQTHFLKEAYLDIELLDSSLWLRLGKQSIVWGKTELFRTTDQFNPQDLALATLPSLEESRIALWAARAVWSLYQVGPFEDMRLEFAANVDHFEGADFGQCGEPYTVNAACNLRAGLFAHGITGYGLAGVTKPEDPWVDIKGLEVGFRAEFRWDRFSFAITDFYGYDDFPFVDQLFRYERNVDPVSGRPRRNYSRGACLNDPALDSVDGDGRARTGAFIAGQPDCLTGGEDALKNHHANQQLFAFICSTSIGFTTLDASVCAQSVFNSTALPLVAPGTPTIANLLSAVLTGDQAGVSTGNLVLGTLLAAFGGTDTTNADLPFVNLGFADYTGDGVADDPANTGAPGGAFPNLSQHLSDAQQALLGCGPLWGQAPNGCHARGIDLLNTEASMITSAWLTEPGVRGMSYTELIATGAPAPGTEAFVTENGRSWCQRFVKGQGIVLLPGCRSPGDPGYDVNVDGDPALIGVNTGFGDTTDFTNQGGIFLPVALPDCPLGGDTGFCDVGHPFTGGTWNSVMEAFSWNFQLLLVVFTAIGADDLADIDTFDVRDASLDRLAADKCSWNAPQFCSNISALLSVMGRRRNSILAGGSSRFGRHDFVWHGGTSNRLKWDKRNVLGFSMDFAEDITKTNWSMETTWIHNLRVADNDALDGVAEIDQFNLTISVDRPTFINFLNQGRTFFINSQWFVRYEDGFNQSMPRNGPFNVLFTLTAFTGFYQDRLNPSITSVYDFMSESGAVLPSINYRFNESFSVEFGMALFYGKWQSTRMALNPISLGDHVGSGAYREFSERGVALVRDRDEVFLRLRKTF